jgi:multidrug efflux pump subunit AcrB
MHFNQFFVKNWQFTLVIFFAVLLLGVNALVNMPRGEDPPFNAPIFSIVVIYPGTSPKDIEQLITDPIEEELYKLQDVKKIASTSADGVMVMLCEFNYGVDIESKNNDVIREINRIRPDLPEGILSIDIKKAASSDVAILQTALVSDTMNFESMKKEAEILEKDIERIANVKWVEVQAVPEKIVKIEIDLEKMAAQQLGLNQVLGLIQANNINIPGGEIDLGNRKYNIKTSSEYLSIDDIAHTVINSTAEGRVTRLNQIARVFYADNDLSHYARHNGKRAVWVLTAMKDKKNIIQTRAEIQTVLDAYIKKMPKGLEMHQAFDQETGVRNRLAGLGGDFLIAILLVLLTLLPLGTRASFIVMISIPLSLSIGLFFLDLLGYTLNQLSIVGMVIALGLLVDDSIVVVENIERYMRKGITAREAAVTATNHIMVAILGCTATLILAFLPLANLPEASGDFIRSLPMAVILTVLSSLFVSVTIIPFLASILLKAHENDSHSEGNFFFRSFKKYINIPYQRLLKWCMKHPYITLGMAALIFFLSLKLASTLGSSVFPASEKPILTVDVETEPGSNLYHTDKVVRKIEQYLLQQALVDHISTNVGKGNPRIYYNEFQVQSKINLGQIVVHLREGTEVPEIVAFADTIRKELAVVSGAKVQVKRFQQGPPISAPIEMRILGTNLDTLEALSASIEDLFRNTAGTIYVRNDLKYKKSDITVAVDRDKAGLYGITSAEVAKTVRLAIAGIDIGSLKDEESDDQTIRVSVFQNTDNPLDNFKKINITSLSGALVPLKNIADISLTPSAPIINHYNKERYALVSSFVATGVNVAQKTEEIEQKIAKDIHLPAGYSIVAAGEKETSQESFGGLGTIIILTVFGLLAILILEFRTFKSTLIVLSVIPMGIIGAILALYLTGETFSFVATVGIIALVGIEIKNSILMVDYTNSLREKGATLYEAVMDGAETRFLPIFLTSLTAIGGMTPLALERSPLISPLAMVLIGGLISSTLLSRLITPVLYYLIPPVVEMKEESEVVS